MNIDKLASVVETLTFLVGEPLDKEDIKKVTGATGYRVFLYNKEKLTLTGNQ